MYRLISTGILACGLGLGVLGCQNDNAENTPSTPSGTPAQTPQGNMQGPAHSNGTEGADTAQMQAPVQQTPGATGSIDQRMANQGRLPTTQPQP
jgi:hypothetical protein